MPLHRNSVVGCQNCYGYKNDPQYAKHDFNSELIRPNQEAYNEGQNQLGTGQTYNQLVTGNIEKDPVGASLAGAGIIGLGVITGGGLPALGTVAAGAGIGSSVNGAIQLEMDQPFDWLSFVTAGVTGGASAGMGFVPGLMINVGGALAESGAQGKNPNNAMAGAAIGTAIGYPIGSKIEGSLNNVFIPWYRQEWKDVGMGMSVWVPKSPIPSWFGSVGSGVSGEITGANIQNSAKDKK